MACGCRKYKIKSTRPEHHKLLQPCVPLCMSMITIHNHMLSIIETVIIRFHKESIVFGVEGTTYLRYHFLRYYSIFFLFIIIFFGRGEGNIPWCWGGGISQDLLGDCRERGTCATDIMILY